MKLVIDNQEPKPCPREDEIMSKNHREITELTRKFAEAIRLLEANSLSPEKRDQFDQIIAKLDDFNETERRSLITIAKETSEEPFVNFLTRQDVNDILIVHMAEKLDMWGGTLQKVIGYFVQNDLRITDIALMQKSELEVVHKNFGKNSLQLLEEILHLVGLRFGMRAIETSKWVQTL